MKWKKACSVEGHFVPNKYHKKRVIEKQVFSYEQDGRSTAIRRIIALEKKKNENCKFSSTKSSHLHCAKPTGEGRERILLHCELPPLNVARLTSHRPPLPTDAIVLLGDVFFLTGGFFLFRERFFLSTMYNINNCNLTVTLKPTAY